MMFQGSLGAAVLGGLLVLLGVTAGCMTADFKENQNRRYVLRMSE